MRVLFRRQPSHKPNTKQKFEQVFKRRVANMKEGPPQMAATVQEKSH